MSAIRVLVVADDPLARAGLATLLAVQETISVVGRAAGSDDLAAAEDAHRPDVVLWDLGWDPETALARLAESRVIAPIAILVAAEEGAEPGWRAGVRGILRRDAESSKIAAAVAAVAQGFLVIDPAYRASLAESQPPDAPTPWPQEETPLPEELTARERDVLRLLAEGLPNKTIAQRLDISEHTVKFHVNAILGKLGVSSRTEAVIRATRLGLIFL